MIRISDVRPVGGGRRTAQVKPAQDKAVSQPLARKTAQSQVELTDEDIADDSPAAEAVQKLLESAIDANATTVHIEPRGRKVIVRYRIDGVLREAKPGIKPDSLTAIAARLKYVANLDPNESRIPQDGAYDAFVGKKVYSVRMSALPVADGEKIVLHIADPAASTDDLAKLGYWGQGLRTLREGLTHKHGLVLVGGPAGSGKTATLYAMLHAVSDPALNIMTVEDAVEHRLPDINQTHVNTRAGMTFADMLRAALKQDPNIIMVGELREPDAANQAVQSALAGRLVLAGMPSRDVAASLGYLAAMDIEPYLIASSARIVVSQRLVRKLCEKCKQEYIPTPEEVSAALAACGLKAASALKYAASQEQTAAKQLGVMFKSSVIKGTEITRLWRAKKDGCKACAGAGYKGRIVIGEVLPVTPAIQRLIFGASPAATLYTQAVTEGMVPLPIDGLVKTLLGITSLDEFVSIITN